MPLWLLALLVAGLAWVSWIASMDMTGTESDPYVLWALTGLAAAWLMGRFLLRSR